MEYQQLKLPLCQRDRCITEQPQAQTILMSLGRAGSPFESRKLAVYFSRILHLTLSIDEVEIFYREDRLQCRDHLLQIADPALRNAAMYSWQDQSHFAKADTATIAVQKNHEQVKLADSLPLRQMITIAMRRREAVKKNLSGPGPGYPQLFGATALMHVKRVNFRETEDLILNFATDSFDPMHTAKSQWLGAARLCAYSLLSISNMFRH